MTENPVRVGLVGAGLIGTLHSFSLKSCADNLEMPVRLVAAADAEPNKAERFREVFGYEKAYGSGEEMIADADIDAVYVCTWTSEHERLVTAAADAGKHVFCEKPLAFGAEAARRMERAVSDAGVVNQVGLVLRQGPVWNVLREEVRSGEYGFPITVIFRDDQCFPVKGAHPSTWRKDPEKAGRGAVIEHSIHDLDLLEWIFGPVVSVRATMAERFGVEGIEDLARIELEFASGMTGTLVSVWHDVLNRHGNRSIEIFHESAFHACQSEFTGPVDVMVGEGRLVTIPEDEVNERFWKMRGIGDPELMRASAGFGLYETCLFLKACLGEPPEGPDFKTAVRAHELVDACYTAAETGEVVRTWSQEKAGP